MNAATETRTAALEIATRVAAENSVTIKAAASGRDHTIIDWTFSARVTLSDDQITVWVPQNRVMEANTSREFGVKVRKAIIDAFLAAGRKDIKVCKFSGNFWRTTGDWHMGSFWTNGRYCAFRVA